MAQNLLQSIQSSAIYPIAVGERLLEAAKSPLGHVTDRVDGCKKFRNEAPGRVRPVGSIITIQQDSSSGVVPTMLPSTRESRESSTLSHSLMLILKV